jgi:hypothetical protein
MRAADPGQPGPRRRGPRRADAPGTGPASADGPEPSLQPPVPASAPRDRKAKDSQTKDRKGLSERERWLLEQRPPHWG